MAQLDLNIKKIIILFKNKAITVDEYKTYISSFSKEDFIDYVFESTLEVNNTMDSEIEEVFNYE